MMKAEDIGCEVFAFLSSQGENAGLSLFSLNYFMIGNSLLEIGYSREATSLG
jgi:hypothetical protein